MMKPGDVRAVRELATGVQAEVCLGADVQHGYAVMKVITTSSEVQKALQSLKAAIRAEADQFLSNVLAGQAAWEDEKRAAERAG